MTYDSDDIGKLREAIKMLKIKLDMIALRLKILAVKCFQPSLKDKPNRGSNYWRTTEKKQRYPIRPDEDSSEAGRRAVQRRAENNPDEGGGKSRKGRKRPTVVDLNTFDFNPERPKKRAVINKYASDYWFNDPRYYTTILHNQILGSKKYPIYKGFMKAFERVRNSLLEAPEFAKYELFKTKNGIATKKKLSKRAKLKLMREIMGYARRIEPEAMALLDEYNRILKLTYEKSGMAYRAMNDDMFGDFMNNGLRPNPEFFPNPEKGMIYCSASRISALDFRNYHIVAQFKDINKKGIPLEYTPLSMVMVGDDRVLESTKYGVIDHLIELEVRLPADHGAEIEVIYIKPRGTPEEAIKYLRGLGWDGKIVIIRGTIRPKGLNL